MSQQMNPASEVTHIENSCHTETPMKITIGVINPTKVREHFRTDVTFWDPEGPPHNSVRVDVFVPVTDSISELKTTAIARARVVLEKALAAPAVESESEL
jgi:hypothetical protein